MTRIEMVAVALRSGREFLRMVVDGRVDARHAWMAARGGEEFLVAVARGDIAPDAAVAQRAAFCRACPSRVTARPPGAGAEDLESDWCGQPLDPAGPTSSPPTCGCLLAGAIRVASKGCIQDRFGPVEPEATE